MERNQELTIAYITVKVNGGANVLRNIFHFNSEAIEDAFRLAVVNLFEQARMVGVHRV
jgi:hypothetical protein